MKATFIRQKLLSLFDVAASVAPRQHQHATLCHVLLDCDQGMLEAQDGENGIQVAIESNGSGKVLLHPARFGSILRESRSESVSIEVDGPHVLIELDGSKFKLPTSDPAEFPRLKVEIENPIAVEAAKLATAIAQTSIACDTESTRYQLGGVCFDFGDTSTLVATDGRRMSAVPLDAATAARSVIVPVRPLALVERMTSGKDADCEIALSQSHATFRCNEVTIVTQLVEGRFPDWRKVMPQRKGDVANVHAGSFLQAVKQAAVVADDTSRGMDFDFDGDCLRIEAKTAQVGQSAVTLPIESEAKMKTTMDHRYLGEWLKTVQRESMVQVYLVSPSDPVLMVAGESSYVLMPMSRS